MRKIEEHAIYEKRQDDFHELAKYFQYSLQEMSFDGAIVYGSVIRNELTSSDFSDIDVVAYSQLFSRESARQLMKYFEVKTCFFYDKSPIFIEDHVSERIEFSTRFGNTVFDISIFPTELCGYLHRYTNTIHDRLDVVIGSMYLNAYLLFGEIPFEPLISEEFIPFYSDDLRCARLQQLKDRILSCLNKIDVAISRNEDDLLHQIYKTRSYLVKWMFINSRKYPVDCNRYLRRQLSQELQVPNETIDCLLLNNDSLHMAYRQFVKKARDIISNSEMGGIYV